MITVLPTTTPSATAHPPPHQRSNPWPPAGSRMGPSWRAALLMAVIGAVVGAVGGCRTEVPTESETPSPIVADALETETVRGPVTVQLSLSPRQPQLSDEPRLTVTVIADNGVDVSLPPFGTAMGEFLIRDFHEPLAQTKDGRQILQQVYTLEPLTAGTLLLQPMDVQFVDNRADGDGQSFTVTTDPLKVEVSTMIGADAPSLRDLKPAERPVALPRPPSWTPIWWAVGTGAALLAAVLLLRLRNRREPPQIARDPQELAREELDRLLATDLSTTDVKLFFVRLTGVVRRYIERSTGVKAPEQTTEEFLREVSQTSLFRAADNTRLTAFLESADLVKFAGFRPEPEAIADSTRRARQFIELPLSPTEETA